MRKVTVLFIIFCLVSTLSSFWFIESSAESLSGVQFKPGRIIDDGIFFNAGTMDAASVQSFLNAKVPVCDTWHAGSGSNQPPFTCLKDYRQDTPVKSAESGLCNGFTAGNKSAAEIITQVAQSCSINPQVLLVLLQKEQSLITDTWPWAIQYRSATGYGCPDTAPCDAEYYGFFNQVYAAARQYKRYIRDAGSFNYKAGQNNYILYHPNAACDGTTVYIENSATAALYNYTPYQPNAAALNNLYGTGDGCSAYGNRNFWRIFNDWFGTTNSASLIRDNASGSIYVLAEGQRILISSPEIMKAYGLTNLSIWSTNTATIDLIGTDGGTLSTTLARKRYDPGGTVYVFNSFNKYALSPEDCTAWAFECFNSNVVKSLPNELIDRYTNYGGPMKDMMMDSDKQLYKMEDGKKRPIMNSIFWAFFGGWQNVLGDVQAANVQQPVGKPLMAYGDVVKYQNEPTLYVFDSEKMVPINTMDDYFAWGLNRRLSYELPNRFSADRYTVSSSALSIFAKGSGSGQIYLIDGGIKRPIATGEWVTADNVMTVSGELLNNPPTQGYAVNFRSPDGMIFNTGSTKKYAFPSFDDFLGLGNSLGSIAQISSHTSSKLSYGGMNLKNGRVYKVQGNDQLKVILNGSKYTLNSLGYPGIDYGHGIIVDALTDARYPNGGTYAP